MVEKNSTKRLIYIASALVALLFSLSARAQDEQTDSLVRLMNASYIEQMEVDGGLVRKAVDATFLHNGTYLICDSSLWVLDSSIIHCIGNVRMIQGETELTSDKLDYLIDLDLAKFRGSLVQLRNQQDNILRTRILDYNTKDSIAVFSGGAAMRSSDGQLIESDDGHYYNADAIFDFDGNVNMYTDSIFIKTNALLYNSDSDFATFTAPINFWKDDDNMLSADSGWYDRPRELFFFKDNVHALSSDQESWSDTLYFFQATNNVILRGAAQVQDTTRNTAALAEYIFYEDSLSRVTMNTNSAVAIWDEQNGQVDTTYFGADTLIYYTLRMCDIHPDEIKDSEARLSIMYADAVTEYRRRAAEEAEANRRNEEGAAGMGMGGRTTAGRGGLEAGRTSQPPPDGEMPPLDEQAPPPPPDGEMSPPDSAFSTGLPPSQLDSLAALPDSLASAADSLYFQLDSLGAPTDSLYFQLDSLGMPTDSLYFQLDSLGMPTDSLYFQLDSLGNPVDSLAGPLDTTKIGFIVGMGNVRVYRDDLRLRADSVHFSQMDSIARFYNDPVIWNGQTHQYTADSVFVLVKGNSVDRASLMSNAFIVVMEDSTHFDQIRSTDVMAYFNEDVSLRRFDALGGTNALFYLEENDELATVNKVECTMLSAVFVDGEVERIFYFDSPKNDAYPTAQLAPADREIRGFNWRPELRPESPLDITPLKMRPSERSFYEAIERPKFVQTRIYFTGYMDELYRQLDEAARRKRTKRPAEEGEIEPVDSIPALQTDSLMLASADSLSSGLDSLMLHQSDSTALADSLAAVQADEEDYMSERELRRALRIARRDARWAELDARDAEKAAQKAAKIEARKQKKVEKQEARMRKRAEKEKRQLLKYVEKYAKQKNKHERTQKSESAGERPPGIEDGGSLQAADIIEREASGGDAVLGVHGSADDSDILGGSSLPGA